MRLGFLSLLLLLALAVGCTSQKVAAVDETDLVPLDQPGAAAPAQEPPVMVEERDEDEPRSRIVQALLEVIDGTEGDATQEERDYLRELLLDADDELAEALGENPREAILDANNRHQGFNIRRAGLRQRPQSDQCCDSDEEEETNPPLRRYRGYQEFGEPPADE